MMLGYPVGQFTEFSLSILIGSALLAFIAVYAGTWFLLRFGILNMDLPGDRSSHDIPTPRGGGFILAPVIVTFIAFAAFYLARLDIGCVAIGGFLIWIIGFLEDMRGLSPRIRLAGQICVAFFSLVGLRFSGLDLVKQDVSPYMLVGLLGLTLFWIVWMTNLYNFMDGINGIAGIQAIALSAGAFFWVNDDAYKYIFVCMICATLGFLPWNFPKARIFLGDSGSLFFGFIFGVCAVTLLGFKSERSSLSMIIWGGPFLIDASTTLIFRLIRGENITLPHRSHFYQRAARQIGVHWPVSLIYGVLGFMASNCLNFMGKILF